MKPKKYLMDHVTTNMKLIIRGYYIIEPKEIIKNKYIKCKDIYENI